MAKPAGLSFENPLYQDANGVPSAVVNPFGFPNAGASSGSDALRDDMAGLAMMGERAVQLARQNRFTMPEMTAPSAPAYYSPASKKLFVQGVTFADDDAQALLESARLLGGAPVRPPAGGDWVPIDQQTYSQFIQNVRNPSLGTLMSRNFGRGVDQTQMLIGRGLQLAGAEQLGSGIVKQQEEDLRRTSPYERQFTDIDSGRGAVEWFLANFAQQGPNLIESVAVALAGAAAGAAAAGPVGGAVGTLAGIFGKQAFKDKLAAAAQKVASGQAKPGSEEYQLLRNTAAVAGAAAASYTSNIATGAADIYGEIREQGVGPEDFGARLTALAGSLPYGALDTVGEYFIASRLLNGGRAALPKDVTTTRVTRGGKTVVTTGPSFGQRAAEYGKRAGIGFGVGAPLEGSTELGQEALVMGLSGQDLTSDEAVNRFVNSFAAGAAIGGPLGAVANLRSRQPENLLSPGAPAAPVAPVAPPKLAPDAPKGTQGALFTEQQAPTPFGPSQLGQSAQDPVAQRDSLLNERQRLMQSVAQAQTELQAMANGQVASDDNRVNALMRQVASVRSALQQIDQQLQQYAGLPGIAQATAQGQQGQLGLFQDRPMDLASGTAVALPGTQGELFTARQAPSPVGPPRPPLPGETAAGVPPFNPAQGAFPFAAQGELFPAAQPSGAAPTVEAILSGIPEFNPAQGALQFSGPPPTPPVNRQMPNQLQARQDRLRREREFAAAEAQQAAQREAELGQMGNQRQLALAAQPLSWPPNPADEKTVADLELMQQGEASTFTPMPMRQAGPTQPVQLELFSRKQAPRPSRAEGLRRGVGTQVPEPTGTTPLTAAEKRKQGKLFTQKGKPTKAATKWAAGKRKKLPAMSPVLKRKRPPAMSTLSRKKATSQKQEQEQEQKLKRGKKATPPPPPPPPPPPQEALRKAELIRKAELVQAGRLWNADYADPKTQPEWKKLTPEQQEQWRKVVIDGKPSIAAAEEIAPPKKEEPPAPKPEAAPAAATSVVPDGPVAIIVEYANGKILRPKDGVKLRDTLDGKIAKFEQLLECLRKAK